jgi:hypothetical protein
MFDTFRAYFRAWRMTPEEAEATLAAVIRTGVQIPPVEYRALVERSGVKTTEHLRLDDGREIGHVTGAITYVDDVPEFIARSTE